jgi:N-methylhydantoinase B
VSTDPFTQEIIKDALVALGDEMFNAMIRTSMSPIIYETTDFAVGATDARGNLLAQGNGVTGFLAMLDTAVQSTLEHWPLDRIRPGDIFVTNSPYEGGGTHLSDVVILYPVFVDGRLIAWTVNKAHWTEVGGTYPGSATTASTDIFQEGLHLRFLKLFDEGRMNEALVEMIRTNVRLPDSTIGDMHAGVAACRVGGRRIVELAAKYGVDDLLAAMDSLLDYGERMTREELKKLPKGVFTAEDVVEEDGHGNGPFVIKVKVTITDDRMIADFTGTSGQAPGPINLSYAGLITGVRCTFKAVTNTEIPANGGCFRALEVICPEGTILSAKSPAPVSIYYESLLGAIEVMWKALAPLMPHKLPVGHQRTVGATFISGLLPGTRPVRDGRAAGGRLGRGHRSRRRCRPVLRRQWRDVQHPHRTGRKPLWLRDRPVCLARRGRRRGRISRRQGRGAGLSRDGEGSVPHLFRHAHHLAPVGAGRRWRRLHQPCRNPAPRWHGGDLFDGHRRAGGGRETFRLVSATGGGYGDPMKRERSRLLADLRDGYVTPEQARRDYGFDPAA